MSDQKDTLELFTAAAILGLLAGRNHNAVPYQVDELANLATDIAIKTNIVLKNKTIEGIK